MTAPITSTRRITTRQWDGEKKEREYEMPPQRIQGVAEKKMNALHAGLKAL